MSEKNKKQGSGGARPGSGRKAVKYPIQQMLIDTPVLFIEIMEKKGVKNKTGYVVNLMAADLVSKGKLKVAVLKKVLKIKSDTDRFNPETNQ